MTVSLIQVQDEYVSTVNAGFARWSIGGHINRIYRGARHKAERQLRRLGFTEPQIAQAIKDARDMAALERNADEVTK